MENGNLKSFIGSDKCSAKEKIRWVKQVADAVQVFHGQKTRTSSQS